MQDRIPIQFNAPIIKTQRAKKPKSSPADSKVVALRQQIAKSLLVQVAQCSKDFKAMSPEERKAIFYRLEHEGTIDLQGTNLKPVQEITNGVTLAVPLSNDKDFGNFESKISEFVDGTPDEYGRPPNYAMVAKLNSMEKGIPFDRLSEPLKIKYKKLIKSKSPNIICEIVITDIDPHTREQKDGTRKFIECILRDLNIAFKNGLRGNMFEHEYAFRSCRAVIRCNGELFQELVEEDKWQRRIHWFDDKPNFESLSTIISDFNVTNVTISPPEPDASSVCIVDSGLSPGNPFLNAVIKTGDKGQHPLLKSFLSSQPGNAYDENGHGSGVGSLAAYSALNIGTEGKNQADVWLAGARITKEDNFIEDGQLWSLTLEKVVEHFAPLGVKIFNLSVNDIDKCWSPDTKKAILRDAWVARKIDTLSRKHDVIFVISTGNLSLSQLNDYYRQGKEYPDFFTCPDTSLYDPAQSALALTVGSIAHLEYVSGRAEQFMAIAKMDHPSPFTRKGPGILGEIKPELVEPGGNLVRNLGSDSRVSQNIATNIVVATHQKTPAITLSNGTSLAAPRVAHKLALLDTKLKRIGIAPSSALLKAFLVSAARWTEEMEQFANEETQHLFPNATDRLSFSRMLFGYGTADRNRVDDIANNPSEYSATLYYQGEIETRQVAFFSIPIPKSLSKKRRKPKSERIRMTVTVSYLPEVQRYGLESYLGSLFRWEIYRGNVSREAIMEDFALSTRKYLWDAPDDPNRWQTKTDGALEGQYKVQCRSRGTIQHDIFEWVQHKPEFSQDDYTLVVAANSNSKWDREQMPIPYAVVVHIEDASRSVPVYSEIRQAIRSKAKTKTRAKTR